MIELLSKLKRLPDAELLGRVSSLAGHERGATALLVAHLAELDTRDAVLREGYSSLFAYCREALGLSEHGALNRIEVARAARRFPAILDMLAEGRVNLTTVRLLAPHLTAANFERILTEARGKRTEEIRAMAGGLSARAAGSGHAKPCAAAFAATVAPGSASAEGSAGATPGQREPAAGEAAKVEKEDSSAAAGSAPAETVRAAAAPAATGPATPAATLPNPPTATPQRRAVTLGGATLDKLRLAKDLLRHALPSGDDNDIVGRALTLLLADLARKKFAGTDWPRVSRGTQEGSRHVPAEVQRVVWLRDLGRCAYVGPSGHRCEERGFLEFHHVRPFEVGGEATVTNIQLRCGRHNRYEARLYFRRDDVDGIPKVGTSAANSF